GVAGNETRCAKSLFPCLHSFAIRNIDAATAGNENPVLGRLAHWGAFLEAPLYEECLVHLQGGESACTRRTFVVRDGIELGTHPVQCHADKVAFVITTLSESANAYEQHLRRLLSFTSLRGMQWMNLNHAEIEFVTLRNGKGMEAKE
ncbi:MAG: hypothetical protein ACREEM_04805, partial [Blastocatellia bacterium]